MPDNTSAAMSPQCNMQPWGRESNIQARSQADVGARIDAVPSFGGKSIDSRSHTIEPILEISPHRTDNNFIGRIRYGPDS